MAKPCYHQRMVKHIHKSHNKTMLLYHVVCPIRYRRKILTKEVTRSLVEICEEIGKRYEIHYVEIGADKDHVHFLIQSVPMMRVSEVVRITKSCTAREIFRRHKEVKKFLWGGSMWTSGYYANTVGQSGNEKVIREYVKRHGQGYKVAKRNQLTFFDVNI